MDATLQALAGLLWKAIPTLILVVILHWYLKTMLFRPLQDLLRKREEATEGARRAAQESLARAEQRAGEYDAALRQARADLYREQEETRRRWVDEQTRRIEEARQKGHALVENARRQLQAEADSARLEMEAASDALAEQISRSILNGRRTA